MILGGTIAGGTGNSLDNTLLGNSVGNSLNGGVGADSLIGGLGNDTYYLNQAGDSIWEISGDAADLAVVNFLGGYTLADHVENLTLGTGNIGTGNSLNNTLTGNTLDNTLDGGDGADTMVGGTGNDYYIVNNAGDIVTETGVGNDSVLVNVIGGYTLGNSVENGILGAGDQLTGNSMANSLFGNNSNNTLNGGTGTPIDTLIGFGGDDYYFVDSVSDLVVESLGGGLDSVFSTITNATLADQVEWMILGGTTARGTGNSLDNTLLGNASNNSLNGGAGADSLIGGLGNDTYYLDQAGDSIWELSGEGTDLAVVNFNGGYTLADQVENLTLGTGNTGTGNSLNNSITGNALDNTLDGGTGADTMVGGTGNDFFIVDNAGDIVTESGVGIDSILVNLSGGYTLGNSVENGILGTGDQLTGNTLTNSLFGNSLNNTLNGGTGNDSLVGFGGDDYYLIDSVSDLVVESLGGGLDSVFSTITNATLADQVEWMILGGTIAGGTGNSLDNTLVGNASNNSLNGGAGADSLIGGLGNDTYYLDQAGDSIWELSGEGTDLAVVNFNGGYTLADQVENLTLGTGNTGTGNSLNNSMTGNSLDNTLNGGTGADTMVGGAGNDFFIVDNAGDVVTESGVGIDSVLVNLSGGFTLGNSVENGILGTGDQLTGNTLTNSLFGNSLNNTLNGGTGNDTLVGGGEADSLFGGDDNDTINGGDGIDIMNGGNGNDYYFVDAPGDSVLEALGGASGIDSVFASMSGYVLANNAEYLELGGTVVQGTGNGGDNTLRGNAASNSLDGGGGNDSLIGGVNDDYYIVDSTLDAVYEAASEGTDSVFARVSGFTMGSDVEWLILDTGIASGSGGSTANTLVGNASANSLFGGDGKDSLFGSGGNDTLNGGTDNDTMVGGSQDDYYFVDNLSDRVIENASEGSDSVYATIGNYILGENIEHLELGVGIVAGSGNGGDNTLLGNSIGNSLSGGGGADTLLGLEGNDSLDGGAGNDSLVGGDGSDLYLLNSTDDILVEVTNEGTDSVQAFVSDYTLADQVEYLALMGSVVAGTGNSIANTLVGNAVGNSLDGGDGIDQMIGGTGNDTYFVNNSLDQVVELANEGSQDRVVSSISGHTLSGNVENLQLTGTATAGTGNSLDNLLIANVTLGTILYGGGGEDTYIGGDGGDLFVVDSAGDSLEGGLGTDSVQADFNDYTLGGGMEWLIYGTAARAYGNGSNNTLIGNSLANTLDGSTGADSMLGGNGNDYYFVDHISDVVIETAGGGSSDTINLDVSGYIVPQNIENIVTSNNVTSVTGNSAGNALVGNALDNTLDGGAGADTLTGGDGNDYFFVDNLGDQIIESLGAASGIDSVQVNVLLHSLSANMEVLIMGNKGVTGYGNSLANTLIGNSTYNLLYGGGGDDYLTGGGGSDVFNGGMGIDTMVGGLGGDRFVVDNLGDSLVGGGGADSIVAEINSSIYTLPSDFNILILGDSYTAGIVYGNSGNNTITGNSLANTLNGNGGSDYLAGELGNDYYLVDSSGDIVVEDLAEGTDTIEFLIVGSSYTLGNNFERLILGDGAVNGVGNSLRNTLAGNTGDNSLSAAAGNDSLFGDSGNDTLLGCLAASSGGRAEIDTLTGGGDSDIFILGTTAGYFYDDGNAGNLGATDYAYIMDFVAGVDKLQLRGNSANYRLGTHTVSSLAAYQGLYRELGATDELIAIIQGSPISALDDTTAYWV